MKTFARFFAVLLWVIAATAALAAPRSAAEGFYTSLVHSVQSAAGRVLIFMQKGTYKCTAGQLSLLWKAGYNSFATIQFDYRNNLLHSASIEFTPPLELSVPGGSSTGLLKTAEYSQDGIVTDLHFVDQQGNPTVPDDRLAESVVALLEISRRPEDLFNGGIFKFTKDGVPIDGGSAVALIKRVYFSQSDTMPGLAVVLRPASTIAFSERDDARHMKTNVVTVGSDGVSSFTFREFDYYPAIGQTSANLDHLELHLDGADINSDDFSLHLTKGSRISFTNVQARSNQDQVHQAFEATGDLIEGDVTNGSSLLIANTGFSEPDELRFVDDSHVKFKNVFFTLTEDQGAVLSVGGGSQVVAKLGPDTHIGLNDSGYVNLQNGTATLNLDKSSWHFGRGPELKGQILDLDANINGARLMLTYGGTSEPYEFDSAHLSASSLALDTTHQRPVQGSFDDFRFHLKSGSTIALPNGSSCTIAEGATVIANDQNFKMTLTDSSPVPIGRFQIAVPKISDLKLTGSSSIELNDGHLTLFLQTSASGDFTSYEKGSLGATGSIKKDDFNCPISVAVDEADLHKQGGHVGLDGLFTLTIMPGAAKTFTTPFIRTVPDHEDCRIFPVTVNPSLTTSVKLLDRVPMTISNGVLSSASGGAISTQADVTFQIQVPAGVGQYNDLNNPAAGGKNDDDAYNYKQEVFRDSYSIFGAPGTKGWFHLYLDQGTYGGTAHLVFVKDAGSNHGHISLSNCSLNGDVKVTEDGGGLLKAIADVFLFVGSRIPGLGSHIPGSVQDFAQDLANSFVHRFTDFPQFDF